MSHSRCRSGGFSLIEVLVVIAILAIIIALLLPAVQKLREASNRTLCTNSLRQLATGCNDYHSVIGSFPPAVRMKLSGSGAVGDVGDANQNFGPNWLVLILPFIDQRPLYSSVSSSIESYMSTGDAGWRAIGQVDIPLFHCPSDLGREIPWAGAGGGWARGNYAANAFGIHENTGTTTGWQSTMGRFNGTSFVPQSPIWNPTVWTDSSMSNGATGGGVMCINWGASMNGDDFKDGTQTTILIGEVRMGSGINPSALNYVSPSNYNPTTDPRGTWAVGMPGASVLAGQASWDCTTPNDRNSLADDVGPGAIDAWKTVWVHALVFPSSKRNRGAGIRMVSWWQWPICRCDSCRIRSATERGSGWAHGTTA